jgi:hypothetical protein
MTIEELVLVTNGLPVRAGKATFTCDRARVTRLNDETVELSFWIAGTDFAPRMRLSARMIASSTTEEMTRLIARVAEHAILGGNHRAA